MMILRFKNKEEYLNNLLNFIFKNILFLFIIFSLILLVFCSIYYFMNNRINIDLNSLFYINYNFIKVFFILELLIKIEILFYKFFSKNIAVIIMFIIQVFRFSWNYNYELVDSFDKIHLFYGYFFTFTSYNTIFLDLFNLILEIIILNLIIELTKKLGLIYKKICIEV